MITVYDDFLDEKDFLFFQSNSEEILLGKSKNLHIGNNLSWEQEIRLDSNIVLTHSSDFLNEKIKEVIGKKIQRNIIGCMYYYWFSMSHIPWHDDTPHIGGMTIYLNEKWNINHGGIFLFSEKNLNQVEENHITGIFPKRNRAIEQIGGFPHSVSCLSKDAEIRRTIQIFYKE